MYPSSLVLCVCLCVWGGTPFPLNLQICITFSSVNKLFRPPPPYTHIPHQISKCSIPCPASSTSQCHNGHVKIKFSFPFLFRAKCPLDLKTVTTAHPSPVRLTVPYWCCLVLYHGVLRSCGTICETENHAKFQSSPDHPECRVRSCAKRLSGSRNITCHRYETLRSKLSGKLGAPRWTWKLKHMHVRLVATTSPTCRV